MDRERQVSSAGSDPSPIDQLRMETRELHLRLHEHPLFVELLTRPSIDGYRAVLEGFLRFYGEFELALVASARDLRVADLYPEPVRTRWLMEDLESLGGESATRSRRRDLRKLPELSTLGALAGCLYVVEGSALGGQSILRELDGKLPIGESRRYFTADGPATRRRWTEFQSFCNRACDRPAARRTAIRAARETFGAIEACLTSTLPERRPVG